MEIVVQKKHVVDMYRSFYKTDKWYRKEMACREAETGVHR